MQRARVLVAWLACTVMCGCMDGPFYALKHLNPVARKEWQKDEAFGPTFHDRMVEMDRLEGRLDDLTESQQEFWAKLLADLVAEDPSPVLRARAVKLLARIPSPHTTTALNRASTDESLRVRLAACNAWRELGGVEARDMLLSMAVADEDSSVRQAAIAALQDYQDVEVIRTLANLLDDPSPAVQLETSRTLAAVTGEQLGTDIQAWKQYVAQNFINTPVPNEEDSRLEVVPAAATNPQ